MSFGGEMMNTPLIVIENLDKNFALGQGLLLRKGSVVHAVNDFSLTVNRGEIVGLIGESGSGKTTLARIMLGLSKATKGSIKISGVDMTRAGRRKIRGIRSKIAVVFQDPAANLNPRQTVLGSIMRPLRINGVGRKEAQNRAVQAMELVKMDTRYLDSYPHQLSGGQQQRVAIARALVLRPEIMILDEPTSALDISVQAQILNLLLDLQQELNLTYLMVTHDINVIRYVSDKVAVMYMGRLVEYGDTDDVLAHAAHPYTRILMDAVPPLDPTRRNTAKVTASDQLLETNRQGCDLFGRCSECQPVCGESVPELREVGLDHCVACHLRKTK
jgi:oligopeptide/dipeptide ABC transporter ATP-binding protein